MEPKKKRRWIPCKASKKHVDLVENVKTTQWNSRGTREDDDAFLPVCAEYS